MTFLEQLLRDLEAISLKSIVQPHAEVQESDQVVGVLDESLLRFYAMKNQLAEHARNAEVPCQHLAIDIQAGNTDKQAEYDSALAKLILIKQQAAAANELFWASVRTQFPNLGNKGLAVRKGFKLVITEPECPSIGVAIPLGGGLTSLFGLR